MDTRRTQRRNPTDPGWDTGRGSGDEPTVLVVDDDPEMRSYLRRCLQPLTSRVTEATGASDALSILRSATPGSFDLVIVDLVMEGMDGLQLRDSLAGDESMTGVPVLIVSGEEPPPGGGPFLRKPFGARALRAWVRALLSNRSPPGGDSHHP